MRVYIRIAKVIADIARYIVEAAIVVIMLLTVADVLMRLIFNHPILGVSEYSQMLMAIILLAAGYTAMQDGHIKVDLVMNKLSEKVQKIFTIIASILAAAIGGLIASRTYVEVARGIREHQTYVSLGIVKWPFYLMFALAMTVMTISAIAIVFEKIIELRGEQKGGEDHE